MELSLCHAVVPIVPPRFRASYLRPVTLRRVYTYLPGTPLCLPVSTASCYSVVSPLLLWHQHCRPLHRSHCHSCRSALRPATSFLVPPLPLLPVSTPSRLPALSFIVPPVPCCHISTVVPPPDHYRCSPSIVVSSAVPTAVHCSHVSTILPPPRIVVLSPRRYHCCRSALRPASQHCRSLSRRYPAATLALLSCRPISTAASPALSSSVPLRRPSPEPRVPLFRLSLALSFRQHPPYRSPAIPQSRAHPSLSSYCFRHASPTSHYRHRDYPMDNRCKGSEPGKEDAMSEPDELARRSGDLPKEGGENCKN